MEEQEIYEKRFAYMKSYYEKRIEANRTKLETYKKQFEEMAEEDPRYERAERTIKDVSDRLEKAEGEYEFTRIPTKEDTNERIKIFNDFPEAVKEAFPDDFPIVFHGTSRIGVVREILASGGLLSPEERGISETSFATDIDATTKNSIATTCAFADMGVDMCVPYGAIFAFKPREDEMEKVMSCRGSEVRGGVKSINFRNQPERLYSIISTEENMDRIKTWCKEYEIDPEKVQTTQEFLFSFKYLKENKIEKTN